MPKVFEIYGYKFFFFSNEGNIERKKITRKGGME